jgi:hypothetical protein
MKAKAGVQESYSTSRSPAFSLFSLIKTLQFSNIHVGLVTATASFSPLLLLEQTWSLKCHLFIFCSTVFIYNYDHAQITTADLTNSPRRCEWIYKNKKFLSTLNICCLTICGWTLIQNLNWVTITLVLALLAICLLYSTSQVLKNLPGIKSIIISLTWSSTCVILPIIWCSLPVSTLVVKLFILCTLAAFINTLFFDKRDLKGDRLTSTRSLPLLIGQKNTSKLIKSLCATLLLISFIDKTLIGFSAIAISYYIIEHHLSWQKDILIDCLLLSPFLYLLI